MTKKTIYYCDVCGIKITSKNKPQMIKTPWRLIQDFFEALTGGDVTYIEGDGCDDCYKSFVNWLKSRRHMRKNHTPEMDGIISPRK